MTRRLLLSIEAEEDIREAAAWYGAQRPDLAREFRKAVKAGTETVRRDPFHFAILWGEVRHYVLQGFPYSILYVVTEDAVAVAGVIHDRRDPLEWRRRR